MPRILAHFYNSPSTSFAILIMVAPTIAVLPPEVLHRTEVETAEAGSLQEVDVGDASVPKFVPVYIDRSKPQFRRIFGFKKVRNQPGQDVFEDPLDETTRYPLDKIGEELGPNARFYRAYNSEALASDVKSVEEYRDAIDVLLVFAGLFSAVVTTFVVQTSENLQPDYTQLTTTLLAELIAVQRASANGSSPDSVPSSVTNTFVPDNLDVWINTLWYISLLLSLTTALIAVLAKQWLHHYTSVTSGTAKERARVRQFRYIGLQQWQVPTIIGLLPVMLHLSLAIFVVGIILFLHSL
ncbi:uncharacterized protein EV420DRAFT_1692404, partial [Desarmillaria tabescens]